MSGENKIMKYIFVGNDMQLGKMTLRKNAVIEQKIYDEIMKNEENKKLDSLFISLGNFSDYKRNEKTHLGTSMKKFKKKEVEVKEEKKEKGGKK